MYDVNICLHRMSIVTQFLRIFGPFPGHFPTQWKFNVVNKISAVA